MQKVPATRPRYVIPDFFENPIIRPYLANVRDWQGYVRFLGLPDRRDNRDIIIDRLFVEPLFARRYVSPDEDPENWFSEAKTLFDALEEESALVLLGDPGIGKSTVLNYVAWLLSRPATNDLIDRIGWKLPIPMVLRELQLQDVTDFEGLLNAFLNHAMCAPLLKDNGIYLMQSLVEGRAFLLLDGIDEVGDQQAREKLRAAVVDGLARYPNCRWLLSSRIVGYDEVPFTDLSDQKNEDQKNGEGDTAPQAMRDQRIVREPQETNRRDEGGGFALRYIAPFDDPRIGAFASNWYAQREAAAARARKSASHLVRAVHANDAIRRLARIPNLLTMMALIHRIETTLPHGRALLYDRITEAYLESIDTFRGIDLGPHDLTRKKSWLARIGFEMQRRRVAQDDTAGFDILVDFDAVESWLTDEMSSGVTSPDLPSARDFLKTVGQRSGLFLPRGEGQYAFVHLSFQEYFAAVALAREVTRLQWAIGKTSRLEFRADTLAKWAGRNVWREVFSFAFELLASREESDWHTNLLTCVFGKGYSKLATAARKEENEDKFLILGSLLAQLVMNSRSGLSPEERSNAIAVLVRGQLQVQSRSRNRLLRQPIIRALLGNGIDTKVFKEIGVQMKRMRKRTAFRLDLANTQVTNLAPLEGLSKLEWLTLEDTQVSDLAPLTGLSKLERLNLVDTQVSDLVPLRGLARLNCLDLSGTEVSNLKPIANLTALNDLRLSRTKVTDLSTLAELNELTELHLWHTTVSDLAPLEGLTNLKWIDLDATEISNLSPLSKLTQLEWLHLSHTPASDLAPLSKLTKLRTLFLRHTQISDLTPLTGLANLVWLHIGRTKVSDLNPLKGLYKLEWLDMDRTPASDLAPLAELTALHTLSLNQTKVSNIYPLRKLTQLRRLQLMGTQVSNLNPLAELTTLTDLQLTRTNVTDLNPLVKLTKLQGLHLSGTKVSDLRPLVGLTLLKQLNLRGTQVSDLSPILGQCELERLDLRDTRVSAKSLKELRKILHNVVILS